jgi:hypothetical protein
MSAETVQLPDRAYAPYSRYQPKTLTLPVIVKASSSTQLKSYLDSIRRICGQLEEKKLIIDILSDRYWMARYEGITGQFVGQVAFDGELVFIADDPLAYAISRTSSDFNIDADPDTIEETVGGTAFAKPLFTFTAGEDLTDITLLIENIDTGEELQWEGSLSTGEELTIDVPLWIVKVEGTADMANVSGQFPRLIPGETNHIKVTGFGSLGTLNITYRDTYL